MAVIIPPESELGRELERWNTPKRLGGENADHPNIPYPRMLYMAHRYSNGKVMCGHVGASMGDPEATNFTNRCQMVVNDADEHARMARHGWCDSAAEALAAFEKAETAVADAAANAEFHARRMSEPAQREFAAAQDAADFHDPDPKPPKKRPSGKKKPKKE